MAFPPRFLDELRERVSLAEIVGRRVKLTRRGREYIGLCPFHNEKTPSFSVVEDKGFYHCFGCGAHGDVIGFAMQTENLTFPEAVEQLARKAGLPVPQSTPEERQREERAQTLQGAVEAACVFFETQLREPGGSRAREYLAKRGLDESSWKRFPPGLRPRQKRCAETRARRKIPRGVAGRGRAAAQIRRRPHVRLFPRPGDLPHRQPPRRDHRLRRARARRFRPAQISQLARHAAFRQGPGALRPGLGARGGRARTFGHRRRGLHGRDRAAPRRLPHRGGALGHGADRNPDRGAVET